MKKTHTTKKPKTTKKPIDALARTRKLIGKTTNCRMCYIIDVLNIAENGSVFNTEILDRDAIDKNSPDAIITFCQKDFTIEQFRNTLFDETKKIVIKEIGVYSDDTDQLTEPIYITQNRSFGCDSLTIPIYAAIKTKDASYFSVKCNILINNYTSLLVYKLHPNSRIKIYLFPEDN